MRRPLASTAMRRAEHVAGRMKAHGHAIKLDLLAIANGLRRAGESLPEPQSHQIDRLRGGKDRAVSRPGMVGVPMRDQRPLDRPHRIDMKPARAATEPGRRRAEKLLWAHRKEIGPGGAIARAVAARSSPPACGRQFE